MPATSTSAVVGEWPAEGLERVDRCPVCGDASRSVLYSNLSDRTYRSAPGLWTLVRCGSCSCAYLDPRPDQRTASLAYRTYYQGPSGVRTEGGAGRWRSLRRSLRNGYLNSTYGYALAPALEVGRYVVPFLPRHRERADEHVRHLAAPRQGARVLDVGCGEGEFLVEMQRLGWSVEGVDPSLDAIEAARARGVPVRHGSLATIELEPASLDAITFRLVFEHLGDPVSALVACRRALRDGGVVWIATPSLDSAAHRVFGRDWIHLEPPRHAVIYTAPALIALLGRVGFEVAATRPLRNARWSFRMSNALAAGRAPFDHAPDLSAAAQLRAACADLEALRRPLTADVIAVIAHAA
jgi:SAM-dependent methyltransferase